MFRALILPIFRSTRLCVTAGQATSCVHYTTSCNTQSIAPEDGRDQRPKCVELIGVTNKPLLLPVVGVYVIYNNDARSNKYQALVSLYSNVKPFIKLRLYTCLIKHC